MGEAKRRETYWINDYCITAWWFYWKNQGVIPAERVRIIESFVRNHEPNCAIEDHRRFGTAHGGQGNRTKHGC